MPTPKKPKTAAKSLKPAQAAKAVVKSAKAATSATPVKTAAVVTTRRRGRPPVGENGLLDRRMIVACAFEMAKTMPLQELSIVRVARELGVTPALIHYYLDGRDALTAGVMNLFYGELLAEWPTLNGDWRDDITIVSRRVYDVYIRRAGVAAYVVAHNRFRMVGLVTEGEIDNGILFFERFAGVIREAGFDAMRTGSYAMLIMELIISAAYATVRHRWPGDHGKDLETLMSRLSPRDFPNTHFVRQHYVNSSAGLAFADGFALTMSGLEQERYKLKIEKPPGL